MLTWFIIGAIVQTVILVERAIRVPVYWEYADFRDPEFWFQFLYAVCVNVMAWPMAILAEIKAIIRGY